MTKILSSEEAKKVRAILGKAFPARDGYKFSVTQVSGVTVKSAPVDLLAAFIGARGENKAANAKLGAIAKQFSGETAINLLKAIAEKVTAEAATLQNIAIGDEFKMTTPAPRKGRGRPRIYALLTAQQSEAMAEFHEAVSQSKTWRARLRKAWEAGKLDEAQAAAMKDRGVNVDETQKILMSLAKSHGEKWLGGFKIS